MSDNFSKLVTLVFALAALCGCQKPTSKPDPAIQKLEARIADLELRAQSAQSIIATLKSADEKRLKELESAVTIVESERHGPIDPATGLPIGLPKAIKMPIAQKVQENSAAIEGLNSLTVAISDHLDAVDKRLGNTIEAFNKSTARQSVSVAAPGKPAAKASTNKYGIPDDVYAGIVAKARKDWADDFNMQEFAIKQEVDSWKNINR